MGTDFFDDDLVREREAALKIKLDGESGGAKRDGHIPSSRDLPSRAVSDLTLTHLARHKLRQIHDLDLAAGLLARLLELHDTRRTGRHEDLRTGRLGLRNAVRAGQGSRGKTSGMVFDRTIPMIRQGTNSGSLIELTEVIQPWTR